MDGGIEAANEGHEVIMSPTTNVYLDYYQLEDNDKEPLAIGGYLPLSKVYEFEPIPDKIDSDKRHLILGGQANLWTEYVQKYMRKQEQKPIIQICLVSMNHHHLSYIRLQENIWKSLIKNIQKVLKGLKYE